MADDTGQEEEKRKDFSSGVGLDSLTIDRLHSEHPLFKVGTEKRKKSGLSMESGWGDKLPVKA